MKKRVGKLASGAKAGAVLLRKPNPKSQSLSLPLPLLLPLTRAPTLTGKKLGLAFFLVAPPAWGNLQLYGAAGLQARYLVITPRAPSAADASPPWCMPRRIPRCILRRVHGAF